MKRRSAILGMGLATALAACAEAPAPSPLNRPNFCAALDDFGAAPPLGQKVEFYWSSAAGDEFATRATMRAVPMDQNAHRLYDAYGPLTHSVPLTNLKARLERCASSKAGRVLLETSQATCDGQSSSECLKIIRTGRR